MAVGIVLLVMIAATAALEGPSRYKIGVGIADMTGPAVEVAFMGYANPEQKGSGIHLRQFSRSFIIEDTVQKTRLVFVSNDCGMMGTGVRKELWV